MYNKNRNDGRLSMSSQRINIIDDQFFDHKSQLMYVIPNMEKTGNP